MRRSAGVVVLLAAVVTAIALVGSAVADDHGGGDRVLRSTLIGSRPANGDPAGSPLFGVNPGGVPWAMGASDVDARRDGRLEVKFEGLLITDTGTANDGTVGAVRTVSASLYCNGRSVGETQTVPLSADGDAEIRAMIPAAPGAPLGCAAPTVFVHPNGGEGTYIAVTGA
jgi:hypothetical protein